MTAHRQTTSVRRVLGTLLVLVATFGAAPVTSAAPSRDDLAQAKARLDALNGELSVLVEEYNLALIRLQQVEDRLDETRAVVARTGSRADAALDAVNDNAADAYMGFQSQFASLLDSSSLADLSDRLEFIGQIAGANSDLATTATNAEQEARWVADELRKELAERRVVLENINARRDDITAKIDEARQIYEQLGREYRAALARQRVAAEAAAEAQAQADAATTTTGGAVPAPTPVPVVNGSVDAVIAAARSVIGEPYVFGAADPAVGFDCSGLTMWAWAHAGVSLPHSSTAQYAALPHVDRTQLQPGDLVFSSYGRLGSGVIDHVALYVGGGQTIAASNPSVPVGYRTIDWDAYVGAGRPGG
jgi:cell wall-associated NlpC family hydrolase